LVKSADIVPWVLFIHVMIDQFGAFIIEPCQSSIWPVEGLRRYSLIVAAASCGPAGSPLLPAGILFAAQQQPLDSKSSSSSQQQLLQQQDPGTSCCTSLWKSCSSLASVRSGGGGPRNSPLILFPHALAGKIPGWLYSLIPPSFLLGDLVWALRRSRRLLGAPPYPRLPCNIPLSSLAWSIEHRRPPPPSPT
jgi:hypothetical protein